MRETEYFFCKHSRNRHESLGKESWCRLATAGVLVIDAELLKIGPSLALKMGVACDYGLMIVDAEIVGTCWRIYVMQQQVFDPDYHSEYQLE